MARKEQAHQSDDLMEKLVTVNRVAKLSKVEDSLVLQLLLLLETGMEKLVLVMVRLARSQLPSKKQCNQPVSR